MDKDGRLPPIPASRGSGSDLWDLETRLKAELAPGIEVIRVLSRSSVAEVYLARDLAAQQLLALKVLAPQASTEPAFRRRFEQQAQTAARLPHPHSVAVLRVLKFKNDLPLMVMPYVKGHTLAERIRLDGPLPVADVRRILGEVAAALATLHGQQQVHGSVQAANVIATEAGQAMLTPFSTAMHLSGAAQKNGPAHDVQQLGALGYELLTARRLADQLGSGGAPRIAQFRPDVDAELVSVIDACLAAERDQQITASVILQRLGGRVADAPSVNKPARPVESQTSDSSAKTERGRQLLRTRVAPIVLGLAVAATITFLAIKPGVPAAGTAPIEIIEPANWAGVNARGVTVQARRSLPVVGIARHPTGVTQVLINGNRAALQPLSAGEVKFTGYIPADQEVNEVRIEAQTVAGTPLFSKFPISVTPADKTYASTAEALGAQSGFRGQRWAVVVGLNQYTDRQIRPLRYADRDAQAFHAFLLSARSGLGGFKPENVRLLLNEQATYRNIRGALRDFLRAATPDDVVFIYFAGHGVQDPERPSESYLLTYDTELANLASTALPMEDVNEALLRIEARQKIVIADACHSAGVGGQVAMRNLDANRINQVFLEKLGASSGGYVSFTASQAAQLSQEGEQWGGGHGVFTFYLLEALSGSADEDEDGVITVGEMMYYTMDKVRRATRNAQVPSISQTTYDQAWPVGIRSTQQ